MTSFAGYFMNLRQQVLQNQMKMLTTPSKPDIIAPIAVKAPPVLFPELKRKNLMHMENVEIKVPKMDLSPMSSTGTSPRSSTYSSPEAPPAVPNKTKVTPSSKRRVSRRLAFDEDKSSPVSGTIIRELAEGEEIPVYKTGKKSNFLKPESEQKSILNPFKGDIDPEFNVVEITDEAKEKLSKIKNKIGGYGCKLCKQDFEDAFGLAQHR